MMKVDDIKSSCVKMSRHLAWKSCRLGCRDAIGRRPLHQHLLLQLQIFMILAILHVEQIQQIVTASPIGSKHPLGHDV